MTKKTKTSHIKSSGSSKFIYFFKDEKTQFAIGLIILLVTFYVFLALISFFFTGADDQSIVLLPYAEQASKKSEIANWTGLQGARLAESMINGGFGIAVFVSLIFPVVLAFRLMKVRLMSLWKSFVFPILYMIWGSLLLSFFFGTLTDRTFLNIGGLHGTFLSDTLRGNLGWPGTFLVILAVGLFLSIFTFNNTIPFLRNLFHLKKKEKHAEGTETTISSQNDEPAVKIGDKIVPDEWVEIKENPFDAATDANIENSEIDSVVIESVNKQHDDENDTGTSVESKNESQDNQNESDEDDAIVESEMPDDGETVEKNLEPYDPTLDLSHYKYPTLDLLKQYPAPTNVLSKEEQEANQRRIITTLKHFGIGVKKILETIGPTITLYEIVPEDGVRISKIRNLEDDIMLSLAATGIRIIAPIPGKGTIGIEVPNSNPRIVSMYATIASKVFQECNYDLPVALGRTITNDVFMFDLCKMPHILVAGATGQGKSVGLNAIITSLLYKKHPSQLKFVLIDPKKVEFNIYSVIEKHFLAKLEDEEEPVITDTSRVVKTLNSICKEMDNRYDLLKLAHTRNVKEYNEKFISRKLSPLKGHRYLPYIVVVVDEFGDLIMTAGKEVEMPIARIAQLARAVGIHMILATQRPSVNIITGVIKANFPARIAFKVSSGIDSKTILDGPGAQQLIGHGDMLFSKGMEPVRIQCAFVDTPEVEAITNFIGKQPGYPIAYELPEPDVTDTDGNLSDVDMSQRDKLFEDAARMIVQSQQGSTSNIQRKFSIGFNRAGRIMDQLEAAGIIGPQEGSKPRKVLVSTEYELEKLLNGLI